MANQWTLNGLETFMKVSKRKHRCMVLNPWPCVVNCGLGLHKAKHKIRSQLNTTHTSLCACPRGSSLGFTPVSFLKRLTGVECLFPVRFLKKCGGPSLTNILVKMHERDHDQTAMRQHQQNTKSLYMYECT